VNRVWSVLLTGGAVVGSLCLLVALVSALFGVKPLVFRTGSMGPEIPAGALAMARTVDAADLEVGDVVSVHDAEGVRVTHRVVDLQESGEQAVLTLRGDANTVPDAAPYPVAEADRVFWSVPWLGHAVAFLSSPLGLLLLGGSAVALLIVVFRPTPRPTRGKRRATRVMVAAPVAAAMIVSQSTTGTAAAFSDSAAVSSSSIVAGNLHPPTGIDCTGGGLLGGLPTYVWTAPASGAPPLGYSVRYTRVAGVGGSAGGELTVSSTSWQLPSSLVAVGVTYRIEVRSRLHSWQSAYVVAGERVVVTLGALGLVNVSSCVT